MAYFILFFKGHFSEGFIISFGLKNAVVSKTGSSFYFCQDGTVYNPFEQPFLPKKNQVDHCAEPGFSVFLSSHALEDFLATHYDKTGHPDRAAAVRAFKARVESAARQTPAPTRKP